MASIPSCDFGSGVQPGSVHISSSLGIIKDDGYGNLYVTDLTGSDYIDRSNTVLRVHTNYPQTVLKYGIGSSSSGSIPYQSSTFSPDTKMEYQNLVFQKDSSGSYIKSSSNSVAWIEHRPELNFEGEGSFTLSFWVKPDAVQDSGSYSKILISKRGMRRVKEFGKFDIETDNLTTVKKKVIQNEIKNEIQDVFPYEVSYSSTGTVVYKNSAGGSDLFELESSASLNVDEFNHVAITRSSDVISLYINGILDSSQAYSDGRYTSNTSFVTFFDQNVARMKQFNGALREVRFYNKSASAEEVSALASANTFYQTPIIGNVFYKTGVLVITSPNSRWNNFFTVSDWKLDFKNTHYIYENECLCRILPGQANVTMNPSARKHPTSDELLDDFGNGASKLSPYITTVGLYSMKGELLLVGKLNQPLKTRDDVTLNINLKWDY